MNEVPERIWAWKTENCDGLWTIAEGEGVEYLRADRARADLRACRKVSAVLLGALALMGAFGLALVAVL